jgi:signal peptidase I
MTKQTAEAAQPIQQKTGETFFEAIASYAAVFVVGLFIFNFIGQNYVIPSGSMENTLLIGDHLFVDRLTLSPGHNWFPFIHYREPKRGDIVVFIKPVPDTDPVTGEQAYNPLVKRLIGIPGDHIHLKDGLVYVNGVPQPLAKTGIEPSDDHSEQQFLDQFPTYPPVPDGEYKTEQWAAEFPSHIQNGELVVPPGKYFMMGDNRHNSADSRFWGFVPRENIIGRPLFNYWSFKASDGQYEQQTGIGSKITWMGHVALHFFTDTRWSRTLKPVR